MGSICGSKQDVDKTQQLKSESTINDANNTHKDDRSELLQINTINSKTKITLYE